MVSIPIKPDGLTEVRTWWVLLGMFVLAMLTQGLKAADLEPPLTLRRIIIRALLAGVAAASVGFLAIDRYTVGWALLLGGAGVVGYIGSEVLGWLAGAARRMFNAAVAAAGSNGGGKPGGP